MSDAKKQANEYLETIGALSELLADKAKEFSHQIERIKEAHAREIAPHKEALDKMEAELKRLQKANRAELYPDGADRCDLEAGALIHSVGERVVHARCVTVEALEKLGFDDGVKIEKSVNWDAIDGWTDSRLLAVGTERKNSEDFGYELAVDGEQGA